MNEAKIISEIKSLLVNKNSYPVYFVTDKNGNKKKYLTKVHAERMAKKLGGKIEVGEEGG